MQTNEVAKPWTDRRHLVVASPELLRRTILVGVVLVGALALLVVLIVHILGGLLGLMLSTLTVVGVHAFICISHLTLKWERLEHTFGLSELVDLASDKAAIVQ